MVITIFIMGTIDARGPEADAAQKGALEGHVTAEPPLPGGAERGGGCRYAEGVRRNVVVAPVEAEHAAIGVACSVILSQKQPADYDVFHGIIGVGQGSQLKMEIVEGALVGISRFPRKAVTSFRNPRSHPPLGGFATALSLTWASRLAPNCIRQNLAGACPGKAGLKRSPKASRLKPVGGESAAAPNSRQKPGFSPFPSNTSPAILKSTSPSMLPAWPVVIASLMEGGVVSPAISQRKLPILL